MSAGRTLGRTSVAEAEHRSNVERFRSGAMLALCAWPAFFIADLYVHFLVRPGRLLVYLSLRIAGLLILAPAVVRLRRRPAPSEGALRFLDAGITASLVTLISVSAIEFGGVSTPLALGVVTVLVGRGAIIAEHWRRSIMPVAIAVTAHPVTLLSIALFVPEMREQLRDPNELTLFGLNMVFVTGAAAVSLYGGHAVWSLRRQLLNSRDSDRYVLEKKLGEGSMGEVWLAEDRVLRRQVAMKLLNLRPGKKGKRSVARFEREVRATAELSHPHTVRIFDHGITPEGRLFYTMERLGGEDLGTALGAEKMAPRRIVRLLIQTCHALTEAHGRGIVHRDLKPENLFLTRFPGGEEFVKVLDFGLAKIQVDVQGKPPGEDETLTQLGTVVGTPIYIAPEVCQGLQADARSDLYALGLILYRAVTGRHAYVGSFSEIVRQRLREDPVPPGVLVECPPELEAVIMRALQREPRARFQSAEEMASALTVCDLGHRPHVPAPVRKGSSSPRSAAPESFAPILGQGAEEATLVEEGTAPDSPLAARDLDDPSARLAPGE